DHGEPAGVKRLVERPRHDIHDRAGAKCARQLGGDRRQPVQNGDGGFGETPLHLTAWAAARASAKPSNRDRPAMSSGCHWTPINHWLSGCRSSTPSTTPSGARATTVNGDPMSFKAWWCRLFVVIACALTVRKSRESRSTATSCSHCL